MGSINSGDVMWNDTTPDLSEGLVMTQSADSSNHPNHVLL